MATSASSACRYRLGAERAGRLLGILGYAPQTALRIGRGSPPIPLAQLTFFWQVLRSVAANACCILN